MSEMSTIKCCRLPKSCLFNAFQKEVIVTVSLTYFCSQVHSCKTTTRKRVVVNLQQLRWIMTFFELDNFFHVFLISKPLSWLLIFLSSISKSLFDGNFEEPWEGQKTVLFLNLTSIVEALKRRNNMRCWGKKSQLCLTIAQHSHGLISAGFNVSFEFFYLWNTLGLLNLPPPFPTMLNWLKQIGRQRNWIDGAG